MHEPGAIGVLVSRPTSSFATQNEKHFFVLVKMIRRASRRNRSDKLRHLLATDLIVNQELDTNDQQLDVHACRQAAQSVQPSRSILAQLKGRVCYQFLPGIES